MVWNFLFVSEMIKIHGIVKKTFQNSLEITLNLKYNALSVFESYGHRMIV